MSEPQFVPGPYKGLVPYDPEDALLFFGRETDRQVAVASLWSRQLTLLYGPSGVGKTSLLQAGVLYHLRKLAQENIDAHGSPEIAVARFAEWQGNPLPQLLESVAAAVRLAWPTRDFEPAPLGLSLLETLRFWTSRLEGTIFLLLDQFEDYLLYHPEGAPDGVQFEKEFAEAVGAAGISASFLIALREDAFSQLDRFKGRISDLFGGCLRLGHLNREMAREAIERPLAVWSLNRSNFRRFLKRQVALVQGLPSAAGYFNDEDENSNLEFRAEASFVEAVLDQVALGSVSVDAPVELAKVNAEGQRNRIETPYLQLVLIRVWQEEERQGSPLLRTETLNQLGGAGSIIQAHLDQVLGGLTLSEQAIAAKVLRYLVTPQGSKIALSAADIGAYAGLPVAKVRTILLKLQAPEDRIVRSTRELSGEERYEIFHDVLGAAILDWQRRFRERQGKKFLAWAICFGVVLGAILALVILVGKRWISQQQLRVDVQQQRADVRHLAIQAAVQPDGKIDLALLLAAQAQRWEDSSETKRILRMLMERQPYLEKIVDRPVGVRRAIAVEGDQDALMAVGEKHEILAWPEPTSLTNLLQRVLASSEVIDSTKREYRRGARGVRGHPLERPGEEGRSENRLNVLALSSIPYGALVATEDFSPSGQCVDQRIRIWRAVERVISVAGEIRKGCNEVVTSIAFAPDGEQVVTGDRVGRVQKWSLTDQGLVELGSPLWEHEGEVRSLALDKKGNWLASGGSDGTIVLWSMSHSNVAAKWLSERSMVSSMAFSRDGARLAVGRSEGTVQLWSVADQKLSTDPIRGHDGAVLGVAFRPKGRLLTVGEDGTVRLWSSTLILPRTSADLRNQACRIANRNLTYEEWIEFAGEEAPYEHTCDISSPGKGGA